MYTDLNRLMQGYLKKNRTKEELDKEVLLYGYRWARKSPLIGEEEASDFYMTLRTRLSRIYHCYNPEKGSFLPYLSKSFRFQALAQIKDRERSQQSDWFNFYLTEGKEKSFYTSETACYEDEYEDMDFFWDRLYRRIMELPEKERRRQFKRLLCLFMHYAPMISDQYYPKVALCCGVKEAIFCGYIAELRGEIEKIRERQNKIKMRLNNMYVGYKTYEYKEHYVSEEYHKETARKKKEYFRLRWLSCKNKSQNLHLTIGQKEVAGVLGVPLGTVGSCIFYARQFLQTLSTE